MEYKSVVGLVFSVAYEYDSPRTVVYNMFVDYCRSKNMTSKKLEENEVIASLRALFPI